MEQQNNRLTKIIIAIIIILGAILLVFGIGATYQPNELEKQISTIANELNREKTAKDECLKNLTYYETAENLKGFTKYCIEYDEKIMELQANLDDILTKDYEKVDFMRAE